MNALVNTGPGILEMCEWPLPEPGPGQVRIRTAACGICATDLEIIAGTNRTKFPAIPGHEWAGTVDAAGAGVDAKWVGRRCVAENELSVGGKVGFEHPGGYAQYFVTEAGKLYSLPDDLPSATATLIEPLAVCVRGINRLRADVGGPVLIFGDGAIGLLMVHLLARSGARPIFVVGGRDNHLALASAFGAVRTLNYHAHSKDLAAGVRSEIMQEFCTIVEAAGSASALEAALALITRTGRILVLGDYRDARADFRWLHLVHREIELIGSNASAGAWPEAVRLATQKEVPLEHLITHRFPAHRFEEAVALVRNRRSEVIKVVLEWE